MSFSLEDALKIAERLRPSSIRRINNEHEEGERFHASQLANIFASDDKETKDEILCRVRCELRDYWTTTKSHPKYKRDAAPARRPSSSFTRRNKYSF